MDFFGANEVLPPSAVVFGFLMDFDDFTDLVERALLLLFKLEVELSPFGSDGRFKWFGSFIRCFFGWSSGLNSFNWSSSI
jgi:hypothetical protein